MNGLRRVHEKCRGPGGPHGGGDLAADDARLAQPGEHDPAGTPGDELDRAIKLLGDILHQVADGICLGLEHLSGDFAAHGATSLTAAETASSCPINRSNSSKESWVVASDSASEGLGWTSMKKPSTPAPAAARAR